MQGGSNNVGWVELREPHQPHFALLNILSTNKTVPVFPDTPFS